jgi:hypothetical protein
LAHSQGRLIGGFMKNVLTNLAKAFIIVLFCLVSLSVFQWRTGTVTGSIIDDEGNPLPGITVTIEGPNLMGSRTTVTSELGAYRFHELPPGTYSIKAEMPGFATKIRRGIVVQVGRTINVNLTISVSGSEKVLPPPPPKSPPPKLKKIPGEAPTNLKKIIDDEMDKLTIGQIEYNPPSEMTEHVKERVEVRISPSLTEDLKQGLKGRGIPQIDHIPVSTVMNVKLTGYDFNILPLSDEEQAVFASGYTQWEFDVTPLKAGKKILQLLVSASFDIGEFGEKKKSFPVMEKEIHVKVSPGERIKRIDWYKVLGVIGGLLGIILAILRISKYLKNKKNENLGG